MRRIFSARGGPAPDSYSQWIPALVALVATSACLRFQPDDLFIYLRMVGNVLEGSGWGFNPGTPVNVASSAAWLLTLLGLGRVGLAGAWSAQWLGALCMALAVAGTARLTGTLVGDRRAAWAAGLALAGDAWVGRWLWSGMETGLAVAVVIWALALRVQAERGSWQDRSAGMLVAVAPLVRPELVLFSLAVLVAELPALRRGIWRRTAWDGACLAVLGAAWGGFCLVTWGSILPSTAIAKGTLGASHFGSIDSAVRVLTVVGSTQVLAALFAMGALWRWAGEPEGISERAPGRSTVVRAIALFGMLMVAAYAMQHVNVYTRYVLPLTATVVALGVANLLALAREQTSGWRNWLWAAVLVLTLGSNLALSSLVVIPKTRQYARSMREIVIPLSHQLGEMTRDGDVIAAPNIGAIGLFSGREILDLNGLATPQVVAYKREGRLLEYLEEHPPRLIVEIEPQPRSFAIRSRKLDLVEVGTYRFEGMFVRGPNPMYLTVYQVRPVAESP